ncbi:S28 family serine protease [Carboxylicivirga sp. M1479]|uniref:S28 family serine protease n=1 Tax=Carboxylicivirga sp. M1479 TaxID=2594476 RepID=UPI0011779B70|nr:S28 family serine protease [Carboxylicivirga sp. M1479]TRX66505.1 peptidase [Carboxylicivirga sp. M1479]
MNNILFNMRHLLHFIGCLLTLQACTKTINTPEQLFATIENMEIEEIQADSALFNKAWLIRFEQPLDHNNPNKGSFKQRIWVSHKNINAPMVMVTEGYSANRNYTSELAKLVESNQIIVEHRYFSDSQPDTLDWTYLTVEQAANDHHRIIQFFKQLYTSKWATTGVSKGGQTAIFHRALFPNDVDLSVPYVAPVNLAREDQRIFDFFNSVGTSEERQVITNFQKVILEKRDEIMPLFIDYAERKNLTFRMGYEKAFELVVLEYPFSFWQWGSKMESIPSLDAPLEVLFDHLSKGSDIAYVSDQSWEDIKPFFYQAYKELGYYAYVPGALKPLLKGFSQDTISSSMFAPGGDTLKFIPTMHTLMTKLQLHDPQIIAIIGENDPWGATSINDKGLENTLRAVAPGSSHLTRINNLPDPLKNEVILKLKETLN